MIFVFLDSGCHRDRLHNKSGECILWMLQIFHSANMILIITRTGSSHLYIYGYHFGRYPALIVGNNIMFTVTLYPRWSKSNFCCPWKLRCMCITSMQYPWLIALHCQEITGGVYTCILCHAPNVVGRSTYIWVCVFYILWFQLHGHIPYSCYSPVANKLPQGHSVPALLHTRA